MDAEEEARGYIERGWPTSAVKMSEEVLRLREENARLTQEVEWWRDASDTGRIVRERDEAREDSAKRGEKMTQLGAEVARLEEELRKLGSVASTEQCRDEVARLTEENEELKKDLAQSASDESRLYEKNAQLAEDLRIKTAEWTAMMDERKALKEELGPEFDAALWRHRIRAQREEGR